jgi:hypothetical protein
MPDKRQLGPMLRVNFPAFLQITAPDTADYCIPRGLAPALDSAAELHAHLDDKECGSGLRQTLLEACAEFDKLPRKEDETGTSGG